MSRCLFWGVLCGCPVLLAVAIWVAGPAKGLSPGLLALFSFFVMWTTFDFQMWTKKNTERRENPDLIISGKPLYVFDKTSRRQGLQLFLSW